MGVLLAINPTAQVLFMYLFGRVADRAGRTPLVVAFAAGSVLALGAAGLAAVGLTEPERRSADRADLTADAGPAAD